MTCRCGKLVVRVHSGMHPYTHMSGKLECGNGDQRAWPVEVRMVPRIIWSASLEEKK